MRRMGISSVAGSLVLGLLFVLALRGSSTSADTVRILLYNADSGEGAFVETGLVSTGHLTATDIDDLVMTSTPASLSTLLAYDCVIAWTNFSPPNPVGQGDRLAEYVDAGGQLVLAVYAYSAPTSPWELQGAIMTDGYSPLELTSTAQTSFPRSLNFGTALTSHPVLDGVADFTYGGNSNYVNVTLDAGATLIGSDNLGIPLIAISSSEQVVGINLYPGSAFSKSDGVWQTFVNACHEQEAPPTPTATKVSAESDPPERARVNVGGAFNTDLAASARRNRERAAAAATPSVPIAPPSTGTGVTISPPSTGDAGLVESRTGLVPSQLLLILVAGGVGFGLSAMRIASRRR